MDDQTKSKYVSIIGVAGEDLKEGDVVAFDTITHKVFRVKEKNQEDLLVTPSIQESRIKIVKVKGD